VPCLNLLQGDILLGVKNLKQESLSFMISLHKKRKHSTQSNLAVNHTFLYLSIFEMKTNILLHWVMDLNIIWSSGIGKSLDLSEISKSPVLINCTQYFIILKKKILYVYWVMEFLNAINSRKMWLNLKIHPLLNNQKINKMN
jgi:hypothetical protein